MIDYSSIQSANIKGENILKNDVYISFPPYTSPSSINNFILNSNLTDTNIIK